MPFEYAWTTVLADCSELQLEAFLDAQKSYLKKNSQHEPCGVCVPRLYEHAMHYVLYKCNPTTCDAFSNGSGCEWFVKSVMCDTTKRCAVFHHGYHRSTVMSPLRAGLNLAMKRFVREQVDAKVTSSRVLNMMIDNFVLDSASDYLPRVQRYSHHYRTSRLADTNNIDDMEALLNAKRYHEGLDENTAFAYGFPLGPNGDAFLTSGTADEPFVMGFSAKRLIRNLSHATSHVLHVDGTFKLNTCYFPVVIMGVSDLARQFHPICFFIVSDLKQPQVESVVRATFRQYQLITSSAPTVSYVMADADVGQRNAIESVVAQELDQPTPPVFLMCFFHVMSNVKKYIAGMSPPSRTVVFKHVYRIQHARSAKDVEERVSEAIAEWQQRADCVEFERKFSQQWLSGRFAKWMCLSSPIGFAKTNNPVEQFNKQVKRDYTLRTRINVNMLAQELLGLSKHQVARQLPFATTHRPSDKLVLRYKSLVKEKRLTVTSWYRSTVAFMLDGEERRLLCVLQRGVDLPRPKNKLHAVVQEEAAMCELAVETDLSATGLRLDRGCGCVHVPVPHLV